MSWWTYNLLVQRQISPWFRKLDLWCLKLKIYITSWYIGYKARKMSLRRQEFYNQTLYETLPHTKNSEAEIGKSSNYHNSLTAMLLWSLPKMQEMDITDNCLMLSSKISCSIKTEPFWSVKTTYFNHLCPWMVEVKTISNIFSVQYGYLSKHWNKNTLVIQELDVGNNLHGIFFKCIFALLKNSNYFFSVSSKLW